MYKMKKGIKPKASVKKPKVSIDLTKISINRLENEINRRNKIQVTKNSEKNMKKVYEQYRNRPPCAILGQAYLPDSFCIDNWYGLDAIKSRPIVSLRFGSESDKCAPYDTYNEKVCYQVDKELSWVLDRNEPLLQEFWKDTKSRFRKLMRELLSDPAHIAIMMAKAAENNFRLDSDASEIEIKYYNKIIALFNGSVIERFKEFTDLELIEALKVLESGRVGSFFIDREESKDYIKAVLNSRGYKYKLKDTMWENKDTEESDLEEKDLEDTDEETIDEEVF